MVPKLVVVECMVLGKGVVQKASREGKDKWVMHLW